MTLWADPPALVVAGAAITRLVDDPVAARRLRAATLTAFLGTGVPLYLDQRWIDWIRRPFGAESGRDFMLNSLVFDFEHRHPSPAVHVVAALVFASYPLWLTLGAVAARSWSPGRCRRA